MQFRIIEKTDGLGRKEYYVEKYTRLWYAPWRKGWVNAISWDDCGLGVPWFNTLVEAQDWVKLASTPISEKIVG